MKKTSRVHRQDLRAAARGYALLVFAVAGFILVAEVVTFLVKLVMI